MEHGIIIDAGAKKFFETEINSCKFCKECKEARVVFRDKDQRHNNSYSNLLPGFSSLQIEIPIDVLVIAEAHGGSRKSLFREQKSLEEEVLEIGGYYLVDSIQTFHQREMRRLFTQLNGKNLIWVFSDLIRCFVWNRKKDTLDGRQNVEIAIRHCRKYLDNEINFLNPKKIVCLGKQVAKKYFGITAMLTHGAEYQSNIIWSYFPSGNTADLWVRNGEWEPVIQNL